MVFSFAYFIFFFHNNILNKVGSKIYLFSINLLIFHNYNGINLLFYHMTFEIIQLLKFNNDVINKYV